MGGSVSTGLQLWADSDSSVGNSRRCCRRYERHAAGFGINGAASGGYPTVLVGGRSATVTNYNDIDSQPSVTFTTPAGSVGPADIQLTGQYGSVTLPRAFEYLQEQVVSSLHPLAMAVDSTRNKLYVADGGSGSVMTVDNTTLATTLCSLLRMVQQRHWQ